MAIKKDEFTETVDTNLKSNGDFTRFYINFKLNGKRTEKIIDYSDKNWLKRDRVRKAKIELENLKENKINPQTELDENIKLDTFIEMHFNQLPDTNWKTTKSKHYSNYLHKSLGSKKVTDIKQMHIKECIKAQQDLGLSARTAKTTIEILNPLFKEAIANRLITFNPCDGVRVKLPKTKKTVLHASNELSMILRTINDIFKDDPYYLSFYLLALSGKRKSEILHLKWENIDFEKNSFLIEDTKNGEHQLHSLPYFVKVELLKFHEKQGWVFESPLVPNQPINNVEKQTSKIKNRLPNFTLHRLRNVIVSAMAEQGISATLMSAALGHNNTNTLSKYLTLGYIEGSKQAAELIENIHKVDLIE